MVNEGCQGCAERQSALLGWVNGGGKWIVLGALLIIVLAVTGGLQAITRL